MKKLIQAVAVWLLPASVVGCGEQAGGKNPSVEMDATYAVGQVWNYHTRPGEEGSRLFIVRADPDPQLGMIFHIYVDGLRVDNPLTESQKQEQLPHVPVLQATLDASVTSLAVEHAETLPDISAGYATWKNAFDAGEGGVFTLSVVEIIAVVEEAIRKGAVEELPAEGERD